MNSPDEYKFDTYVTKDGKYECFFDSKRQLAWCIGHTVIPNIVTGEDFKIGIGTGDDSDLFPAKSEEEAMKIIREKLGEGYFVSEQ
jgi:hypothetical protein